MASRLQWVLQRAALGAVLCLASAGTAAQGVVVPGAQQWRAILDRPAPTSGNYGDLSAIYLERGEAARALGDAARELAELEAGLRLIGDAEPAIRLWRRVAGYHADRGHVVKSMGALEAFRRLAAANGYRILEYSAMASIASWKARLYDGTEAAEMLRQLTALQTELRRHPPGAGEGRPLASRTRVGQR